MYAEDSMQPTFEEGAGEHYWVDEVFGKLTTTSLIIKLADGSKRIMSVF